MAPKDSVAPNMTRTTLAKEKVASIAVRHRGIDNIDIDDILDKICDGKQEIVSSAGSSQYGDGLGTRISASTCGLAALNFARIAFKLENQQHMQGLELLAEILSPQISAEITSVCDYWKSDSHLEIEELLKVPIFRNSLSLQTCTYSNTSKQRFFDLLQDMADASPDRSVVAIITRPPEILACLRTRIADKDVYIIFDSHPRPDHPDGLGFIINPSIKLAASYLGDLLSFDDSIINDPSLQWQAQLLGYFSGHILLPLDDEPPVTEMLSESSLALLSAYADIANEKSRNSDLLRRIEELEKEQQFMENRVRHLEQRRRQEYERYREKLLEKERDFEHNNYSRQAVRSDHRRSLAHPKDSGSNTYTQTGPSDHRRTPSDHQRTPSDHQRTPSDHQRTPPDKNSQGEAWQTVQRKDKGKGRVTERLSGISFMSRRDHNAADSPKDKTRFFLRQRVERPQVNTTMPGEYSEPSSVTVFDRDAAMAADLQREFEEENRQLMAQRNTLMRAVPRTFECSICFDEHPEDFVARVDGCDDTFCRSCLRSYICSKIRERRFPIFCPVCVTDKNKVKHAIVDQATVQQIGVSDRDYQIFEELQITSLCIPLHCRRCNQTMYADRGEVQETKIIVCPWPGCQNTWCKACQQQIEIGGPEHSCDGTNELRHLMQQQGWKNCPGCTTPVQKSEGCNHMTCITPACNSHFCYIDGELIVKGGTRKEIERALNAHYRKCKLFDYPGI